MVCVCDGVFDGVCVCVGVCVMVCVGVCVWKMPVVLVFRINPRHPLRSASGTP
jgi:hypothetical protein